MRERRKKAQNPSEKKATQLLEDWIANRTPLLLSMHLNIGSLIFIGNVYDRHGEFYLFRSVDKQFAFMFSPGGSARIRTTQKGRRRGLGIDQHRYLIEGVQIGFYDSIELIESPGVTELSSLEEVMAARAGAIN